MSAITDPLQRQLIQVLLAQVALLLIAVLVAWPLTGASGAASVLYGGIITLVSTWWLGRRVYQAGAWVEKKNMTASAMALYGGVILRFVFVLAMLAAGMGALKLPALPLLAGFAITQLGYLVAAFWHSSPK